GVGRRVLEPGALLLGTDLDLEAALVGHRSPPPGEPIRPPRPGPRGVGPAVLVGGLAAFELGLPVGVLEEDPQLVVRVPGVPCHEPGLPAREPAHELRQPRGQAPAEGKGSSSSTTSASIAPSSMMSKLHPASSMA